jgi:hypothetical protein
MLFRRFRDMEPDAVTFALFDNAPVSAWGVRAVLRGARFEAIECFRKAVWAIRGH